MGEREEVVEGSELGARVGYISFPLHCQVLLDRSPLSLAAATRDGGGGFLGGGLILRTRRILTSLGLGTVLGR